MFIQLHFKSLHSYLHAINENINLSTRNVYKKTNKTNINNIIKRNKTFSNSNLHESYVFQVLEIS